ncbi:unnamed protein product [Chrysoparadoxa australica]
MNIFVSTAAFDGKDLEEIISIAESYNLKIEFSSNLKHHPDAYNLVEKARVDKLTHNYFPAPEIPFVLNLASLDKEIKEKSIEHCIKALEFGASISAPFYAAHAGYCLDPNPQDLGNNLTSYMNKNREEYWNSFIDSVKIILREAEKFGINFLIENNVITKSNFENYDLINPLLCTDSVEVNKLFSSVKHDHFGLLLDTAHLKISSKTLGFDLNECVKNIEPYIKAIHHSDNNGEVDSNNLLTNEYWFRDYLKRFEDLDHVLEVKNISLNQINSQLQVLNSFV